MISKTMIKYFIIFSILIIGIFKLLINLLNIRIKYRFAKKYLKKYRVLTNIYNESLFDLKTYEWLTLKSVKIQSDIGDLGVLNYKPPYANYMFNDYQIIVNTLPEMKIGTAHPHNISVVDDTLLRYIGTLSEDTKSDIIRLINPVIWFREGVSFLLAIPVYLFYWSGLFSITNREKILTSSVFKMFSIIIVIIGLISSIFTIVNGWDNFFNKFN